MAAGIEIDKTATRSTPRTVPGILRYIDGEVCPFVPAKRTTDVDLRSRSPYFSAKQTALFCGPQDPKRKSHRGPSPFPFYPLLLCGRNLEIEEVFVAAGADIFVALQVGEV